MKGSKFVILPYR